MIKREAVFSKDLQNKKLTVVREFDAPLEMVWQAWTESGILDQWWAPKPWKAETKTMDFRAGGRWLYCMVGPDGTSAWCRVDYHTVEPQQHIVSDAMFCDENGVINPSMPVMNWDKRFSSAGSTTKVQVVLSFDTAEDMATIIQMGFQEGFSMGLGNLDEYLRAHVPA